MAKPKIKIKKSLYDGEFKGINVTWPPSEFNYDTNIGIKIEAKPLAEVIDIGPALWKRDMEKFDALPTSEYEPDYRASMYIYAFVKPQLLKQCIERTVRALKPQLDKFDAIAFTGMSGCLIGPPVAMALGKEVIMVRKPDTSTHSGYEVEGDYNAKRYIIIDDFRQTGETENRIVHAIKRDIPDAEYVGFISAKNIDETVLDQYERTGAVYQLEPKMDFGSEPSDTTLD